MWNGSPSTMKLTLVRTAYIPQCILKIRCIQGYNVYIGNCQNVVVVMNSTLTACRLTSYFMEDNTRLSPGTHHRYLSYLTLGGCGLGEISPHHCDNNFQESSKCQKLLLCDNYNRGEIPSNSPCRMSRYHIPPTWNINIC